MAKEMPETSADKLKRAKERDLRMRMRYLFQRTRKVQDERKTVVAARKAAVERMKASPKNDPKFDREHRESISYMGHDLERLRTEQKALKEERQKLQPQMPAKAKAPSSH